MNRALLPAIGVGVIAATIIAGSVIAPVPATPSAGVAVDQARVSVWCPSAAATSFSSLIAVAGDGLASAPLATEGPAKPLKGVDSLTNQAKGVRVTGPRTGTFGAASSIRAAGGAERGLSMVACEVARSDAWFTGVSSNDDAQAELVLANLDGTEAAVDVTVFGADGRLPAPGSRGIVVGPNSQRTVALGPIASSPEPLTLHVSTSQGRVAVLIRQRLWRDVTPIGAEWVAPTADPGTRVIIPGIPPGRGRRDLVIVNPGDRTASVAIEVLGAEGATKIPGHEAVDVPAQTTRVVQLERGLLEAAATIRLTSEQNVTAAVISGTDGGNASYDFATQSAAAPLGPTSLWAVPLTKSAKATLFLTNADTTDAAVEVAVGSGSAAPTSITVPAGSVLPVEVPAGDLPLVRLTTSASSLYAAVAAKQSLGKVAGLGTLTLRPTQAQLGFPELRHDPHAGS